LAWWNEDGSNPEAKESYIIHCADFGKGIDFLEKKLSAEWASYKLEIDAKIQKEQLFDFRSKEWKEMEEYARRINEEQMRQTLADKEREVKETRLKEELLLRQQEEGRKKRSEYEKLQMEREREEVKILKEKQSKQQEQKALEEAEYNKYLEEKKIEEERLIEESIQAATIREEKKSKLEELAQNLLKKLQSEGSKLSYFEKRKVIASATEALNWSRLHPDGHPTQFESRIEVILKLHELSKM